MERYEIEFWLIVGAMAFVIGLVLGDTPTP